jgi:uncharacterized protein YegJ (DUF2314 family)
MKINVTDVMPPVALSLCIALLTGCDSRDDAGSNPGNQNSQPKIDSPAAWRVENSSTIVANPQEMNDRELSAAIAQARATADEARTRWLADDPAHRDRWAIKWAAPTADDRIEHVWVQPVNWSLHRIEGILTSEPINELTSGQKRGDLVSFPIEELSDWVHYVSDPKGPADNRDLNEGGYTMKVLKDRYGSPLPK